MKLNWIIVVAGLTVALGFSIAQAEEIAKSTITAVATPTASTSTAPAPVVSSAPAPTQAAVPAAPAPAAPPQVIQIAITYKNWPMKGSQYIVPITDGISLTVERSALLSCIATGNANKRPCQFTIPQMPFTAYQDGKDILLGTVNQQRIQ